MPLMRPNNIKVIDSLLQQFLPYARKKWGYETTPTIRLAQDPENAKKPLGKTAYYEPEQKRITVYVDGRHPKDVMRSVSHELVHHVQNLRGDLTGTQGVGEQGYAQNNDHLREMEREAYEQGNLCFRDWEDGVKAAHPNMYNEGIKRRKNKVDRFTKRNNLINERLMHKFGLMKENRDHYVQESEWHSDEHETLADKKFADNQQWDQHEQLMGDIVKLLQSDPSDGFSIDDIAAAMPSGDINKIQGALEDMVGDGMLEVDEIGMYTLATQGGGAIDRGYMEEPEDGYGSPAHYQEGTIQEKLAKIFVNNPRYLKVIEESGISREELINRVRGQIQEYGDHETQAQGGMVSSTYSSDPEMDQVADIAATVAEQGGGLMQVANALKDQGFSASLRAGVLMIDDKYFMGKPEKFDIGPDEPVQEVGPYVVGMMDNQMEEGFTYMGTDKDGNVVKRDTADPKKKKKKDDWYDELNSWTKKKNKKKKDKVSEASNNPPKAADGYYIHLKRTPLRVVGGSLKGAEGKAIEITTSTTGETAIVVELTKDAERKVFGKAGDEVIVLPGDVETIGTYTADDPKMDYYNDMPSRDGELREGMGGETGEDWDDLLSQIMNASPDADAAQMAERAYDLVEAGNIDAATDLIADIINNTSDPETSETAEKAYDAVEARMQQEQEGSGYKGWDSASELERAMKGMDKETFRQVLKDVQKQLGLSDEEMAQKIMKFVNSGSVQEGADGGDKEARIRDVVKMGSWDNIDGVPLSLPQAELLVAAMENLNPANKEKLMAMPIDQMLDIVNKMVERGVITVDYGRAGLGEAENNVIDGDKPERMWSSIVDNTPMRGGAIAEDELIAAVTEENPDLYWDEVKDFLDALVQQKSLRLIPDEGFGAEYQMMTEGFRGSPEEKEMTSKMSNKEFYKYHTRDKHIVPDLKGDMEPIPGMEGPFQFASGAVLYYDPKVGKYYDRGKDMYLDNEEAAQLTMESEGSGLQVGDEVEIVGGVEAGQTGSVKEPMANGAVIELEGGKLVKVKDEFIEKAGYMSGDTGAGEEFMEGVVDAIHKKLQEYGYEDDYEDEDPEMAALEKEFPWLSDEGAVDADAEAAAAADAAAAGEFEAAPEEEEEEEPTIMKETHDEDVFAMGDAIVDALGHEGALENMYKGMGKDEGKENMEYIARHYEVGIPDIGADSGMDAYWEAFDMMRATMGDEEFFDNTIKAMDTQTATDLFEFIMQNYEISVGGDEVEDFDPSKHWQESADDIYDKRNKRLTESLWKWAVK